MSSLDEAVRAARWRSAGRSPTGRRVLDVRRAVRSLLSVAADPGPAMFFAEGCPIEPAVIERGFPEHAVEARPGWSFDAADLDALRRGYEPQAMEDKWVIRTHATDDGLHVAWCRSWTARLRFVIEVDPAGAVRVWHDERDELAVPTLRALCDGYLFGRPCVLPGPAVLLEDRERLVQHAIQVAGRHADYVEPASSWMDAPEPLVGREYFVGLGQGPGVVERVARAGDGRWTKVLVSYAAGCLPEPKPGVPEDQWTIPIGRRWLTRAEWVASVRPNEAALA